MARVVSRSVGLLLGVLLVALAVLAFAGNAAAQGDPAAKQKVVTLVKEAMDAYSNLDLAAATGSLEEALGYAPDLDKATLARLYIAYGTIRIGGSGDNGGGQNDFIAALCLDAKANIDPLMSTPDIDAVFSMSRQQATPDRCQQVLSTMVLPADVKVGPVPGKVADPGVPPCGNHQALTEIRQRFELPVYIDLDPAMRTRLARLTVKYAFDGGKEYKEIPFGPAGAGFGAQVTCDEGQIRLYDPASISYFIEGYDRLGNLICGHGTAQGPNVVAMSPDAAPPPGAPGLAMPKECTPCPPWDQTCGQAGKPGDGAMCDPAVGCADGFTCGEAGICEASGSTQSGPRGPQKFYINVGAGVGFGYFKRDGLTVLQGDVETGEILKTSAGGFAFGGVPARLGVGFFIKDWLSLEATFRLDVSKVGTRNSENVSCYDAVDGDMSQIEEGDSCTAPGGIEPGTEDFTADIAKRSVALDADTQEPVLTKAANAKNSWLVNVRARFRFLEKGGLKMSAFAGVGYGHTIYNLKFNGIDYYPAIGFINIEIGAGLYYYFVRSFGLGIELPIDFLVGDGFAFHLDPTVVLSFGF